MRPIKFRAYDKVSNEMLYSKKGWVFCFVDDEFYITSNEIESNIYFHQDDLEIMQFTGLHDKNGNEIYEGDILSEKEYDGISEYLLITKVIFSDNVFCLQKISGGPKSPTETIMSFPIKMPQITGNIYENLEYKK